MKSYFKNKKTQEDEYFLKSWTLTQESQKEEQIRRS